MHRLIPALVALLGPFSLPLRGDDGPLSRGEALLGDLACTACHSAEPAVLERLAPVRAPRLDEVGRRWMPGALERFLLRPHGERPGTAMPDVLGTLDKEARRETVEALTHWLVSRGGPIQAEPLQVSPGRIENGRQLYHSVGCVACHAPQEPEGDLEVGFWEFDEEASAEDFASDEEAYVPPGTLAPSSVAMGSLARRTTPTALADFLEDPLAVRPSGRMPSLGLTRSEAEDIAFYLLREQAFEDSREFQFGSGLAYDLYEGNFKNVDPAGPTFETLPVRSGVARDLDELPEHPDDRFAFRFEGFIEVTRTGNHGFATNSDDGSRLYVGGKLVVENDGNHGPRQREGELWLEEGRHPLLMTYYEATGGETFEASWKEPESEWSPLPAERLSHAVLEYSPRVRPFAVDPVLAREGRLLFESLGCAACHEEDGPVPPAPGLFELDGATDCLVATYDLDEGDRAALSATLSSPDHLAEALPASVRAAHTLQRFRCYSCHRRDGIGGVHPERSPYFKARVELDLGNEGRLPPHLERVGAKLHEPWLAAVLEDPEARVRPYLEARMPIFGKANLAGLAEALAEADRLPGGDEEPTFTDALMQQGRELVGTGGLGCIQCHHFGDYESLGIPAVDLTLMYERIRPGWFHTLLMDPESVGMNSRMPIFWDAQGRSPVQDIFDGDPAAQARAVRAYLSLGTAMPLPDGLVADDAVYELQPSATPMQAAVFLEGVGPRVLLVGTPELLHYAFDIESSTLTHLWRGRYFNAKGTWHGRAGALEAIPESSSVALPLDAPFARLEEAGASWPSTRGREAGVRPLGRRVGSDGLPRFRYAWEGIEVEDWAHPAEGGGMVRTLRLSAGHSPKDTAFLLFRTEAIRSVETGTFEAQDLTLRVDASGAAARLRHTARGDELVLDLAPDPADPQQPWQATVEVSYQWQ